MVSTDPLIWFGALITLCVLSFLYKESRFYRFAEYTYISVAVGHTFVMGMYSLRANAITPIIGGAIDILVMFLFSLLIIAQPFKRISWISRWPNAILIGVGTAVCLYGAIGSDIIGLTRSTIKDAFIRTPSETLTGYFSIIGTICVIVYFFFTIKREALRGSIGILSQIGRYFMMVGFGAVFANIVLSRATLFFSRMVFLLSEWLGLV
jgi:hypothetical protein